MRFILCILLLTACSGSSVTSDASPAPCTESYKPVCGKAGLWTTFQNACEAERAGAEQVREGVCE